MWKLSSRTRSTYPHSVTPPLIKSRTMVPKGSTGEACDRPCPAREPPAVFGCDADRFSVAWTAGAWTKSLCAGFAPVYRLTTAIPPYDRHTAHYRLCLLGHVCNCEFAIRRITFDGIRFSETRRPEKICLRSRRLLVRLQPGTFFTRDHESSLVGMPLSR